MGIISNFILSGGLFAYLTKKKARIYCRSLPKPKPKKTTKNYYCIIHESSLAQMQGVES